MPAPNPDARSRWTVRLLESGEVRSAWDVFVSRSEQANPFTTTTWLESSAAALDLHLDFWVVLKGQEWVSAVAMPHRHAMGRKWFRGLPLAAYSTVVHRERTSGHAASRESERIEAGRALAQALSRNYRLISLLLSPTLRDVRPWQWEGWTAKPRYTCVLGLDPLPVPTDSVRRHVRKCVESGVRFDGAWDLDSFWGVFEETRERQGFDVRLGRERFFGLAKSLKDAGLAWMATARTAPGEPVSSQIMLGMPGTPTAFMWLAGTRREQLASGVSAWLMLEIASELARRGHRQWDLCGADYPNVARFKSELGSALQPYFQVESPRSTLESLAWRWKRRYA